MANICKELGKKVRKYRKYRNISTPEFAKKLNISTGLVSNLENGKSDVFKLDLLVRLTKVLNVSLGELLDLDDIDIRSFALEEEIKKIMAHENRFEYDEKIKIINENLTMVTKAFLSVISMYDCDDEAIKYITNHILEEFNFIKNIDKINSKIPVI